MQFEDTMDRRLTLEYLPVLRTIAAIARAATPEDEQREQTRKRKTRSQKGSRSHYFDKISRKMYLGESELSSAQLGELMADTMLLDHE